MLEEAIGQAITSEQPQEDCLDEAEENVKVADVSKNEGTLKHENSDEHCMDTISTVEHDYILHQECILTNDGQQEQQQHQLNSEESFSRDDCAEYVDLLVKAADVTNRENENDEDEYEVDETDNIRMDIKTEQDSPNQNETRRSKRKLVRRNLDAKRDSDEENYFENLNLSSRLKKAQASDKSEKIFFMCYLCDKEFLSKNVLKEHMHSHEEVRKALSLKKVVDKPQKSVCNVAKLPPSGKRTNKCPYCGKQYIYIISFSKHLKKHEREKEDTKDESMPLEISFHEDEHSLDLDGYGAKRHLSSEYRKRVRRREGTTGGGVEKERDEAEEEDQEEEEEEEEEDETDMAEKLHEELIEEEEEEEQEVGEIEQAEMEENGENEKRKEVHRGGERSNTHKRNAERETGGRMNTFACNKCPEKFSTKRGLRKHAISHVILKCSVCEEEFDSLEKLRNHRAKHVVEGVLTEQDLEMDTECSSNKEGMDGCESDAKVKQEEEMKEAQPLELEKASKKHVR